MTEKLLQFIWQFGHFDSRFLFSTSGEKIVLYNRGNFNTHQGPDFLNARIAIGDTTWAGNIELHVHASEWWLHQHQHDKHYDNVILHVVWAQDTDRALPFPTLVLQPFVSVILLNKYEAMMANPAFIPCQNDIAAVPDITLSAWKERLLIERLQERAAHISELLKQNQHHWEEVFWWLIARNFGIRINSESFEAIARSIPINILSKHKSQIQQIEALLLGQAALLDKSFEEDYPNMLRKEYNFLAKKYQLKKAHVPLYFLRMRPANFPTIRLAQLAALIQQSQHLFSTIREADEIGSVKKLLKVSANDYWHYHYRFDEETAFKKKSLGEDMISNICINTIVPMLYAYGFYHNDELTRDKAISWMVSLSAEKNAITRGFQLLGVGNHTAADSQALIQLKNKYCNYKHCLSCSVGNYILKH